ncbi:MAG: hypothetical protein JWO13_3505 [Acidobacteriales bacterium]|nr:hypothetical protein [Terriglobales bacterium]
MKHFGVICFRFFLLTAFCHSAFAQQKPGCAALPSRDALKVALTQVIKEGKEANTGLGNQEWASIVDRDGTGCAVVFSGPDRGAQWPGSRAISAEKASTANAFSTDNFALSTANLYSAAQPGGRLFSIINSSPPNPLALIGDPNSFGQANDPIVGKSVGGAIVFGGGLPLYDQKGKLLGGIGLSGDTSCADHVIAWKVRHLLKLDGVPMGVSPGQNDNMILDIQNGTSPSGFGHPSCKGGKPSDEVIKKLDQTHPIRPKS